MSVRDSDVYLPRGQLRGHAHFIEGVGRRGGPSGWLLLALAVLFAGLVAEQSARDWRAERQTQRAARAAATSRR